MPTSAKLGVTYTLSIRATNTGTTFPMILMAMPLLDKEENIIDDLLDAGLGTYTLLIDTEQPATKRAMAEKPDGVKPSIALKVPSTQKFPIAEAVIKASGLLSKVPDGMLKESKRQTALLTE